MTFILALFVLIMILNHLDKNYPENFEVYHPTTYERKPKLPCYNYNLNFKCANQTEDLDNQLSNVCQTPAVQHCQYSPYHVMARSVGRPRTCRRIID